MLRLLRQAFVFFGFAKPPASPTLQQLNQQLGGDVWAPIFFLEFCGAGFRQYIFLLGGPTSNPSARRARQSVSTGSRADCESPPQPRDSYTTLQRGDKRNEKNHANHAAEDTPRTRKYWKFPQSLHSSSCCLVLCCVVLCCVVYESGSSLCLQSPARLENLFGKV